MKHIICNLQYATYFFIFGVMIKTLENRLVYNIG